MPASPSLTRLPRQLRRPSAPRQKFTTHEGNAGITIDKVAAKMSDEDWHKVLDGGGADEPERQ